MSILDKVEALLNTMSLDQKIGQMVQTERMAITPEQVKKFHIGSVLSGGGSTPGENKPQDWIDMNDAYWQASTEKDEEHLGIPILYGVDAVHGHNNVIGATIFPHNIGLGAMRDPDLIEDIAKATAKEILATGVEWTFAPTLAVAKNYKWGRTYESYSEDPGLVASYANRFVRGLQGDLREDGVVACAKHWVGDGGTTNGIDQGDTKVSEQELRDIHISPYLPALEEGVLTVMASFNSWNGDKCHGHKYLLTDVLKNELKFNGFIISDWDGIDYLHESYYEAVAHGVNAGVDMFMISSSWLEFISHLRDHVNNGNVDINRINDAVRRILYVKMKYGLFERPRPAARPFSGDESFGGAEHRAIARKAVQKSQVLIKNDNDILPIPKSSTLIVAGKSADDCGHLCGGFTVAWQGLSKNSDHQIINYQISDYSSGDAAVYQGEIVGGTSVWDAVKEVSNDSILNIDGTAADSIKHDYGLVVIGEKPYAEGMGDIRAGGEEVAEAIAEIKGLLKVLHPYAHSLELNKIHPEDLRAIMNIKKAGVPVIVVFVGGRPLVVNKELEASDAFVAAWLPGSEGAGITDCIYGDAPYNGKLSFTWYKNEGQSDVLFPFGYGLNT